MYVLIDIWMGRESQAQVSGKFIHCINTIFTIRNTDYPPPPLPLPTYTQSEPSSAGPSRRPVRPWPPVRQARHLREDHWRGQIVSMLVSVLYTCWVYMRESVWRVCNIKLIIPLLSLILTLIICLFTLLLVLMIYTILFYTILYYTTTSGASVWRGAFGSYMRASVRRHRYYYMLLLLLCIPMYMYVYDDHINRWYAYMYVYMDMYV